MLYIDEGTSFGGSLVVVSHLIRYLPENYRAVVVSETDDELLEFLYPTAEGRYVVKRRFNYTHWDRVRPTIRKFPTRILRSLLSMLVTIVAGLCNAGYYFRVWRIVRRHNVGLIHHANGASHLLLTFFGCANVATMQGIKTTSFSAAQRWAHQRMQSFVMISEAAREAYLRFGGREEITTTIPNPCDPKPVAVSEHAAIRERFGLKEGERSFAIFGRVVHWKGQKEFAQAALKVLEQVPNAKALIVGDAADGGRDYLDEVRAIIDASPHGERVIWTGYVADVHELYSVIDIAVHASIVPEPFGLVVIEPMGYGKPIVAANAGGPVEIVESGVDGYLVDPRDTDALASTITQLLTDDALRERIGAAAKAKVEAHYHARRYAEKISAIYEKIYLARSE